MECAARRRASTRIRAPAARSEASTAGPTATSPAGGAAPAYDWDEVGRLVEAQRWDGASEAVDDPLPSGAAAAHLKYAYDAGDDRVVKEAIDPNDNRAYTLYLFETLELRRASWISVNQDYDDTAATETAYVSAHGVTLGRLWYEPEDAVPTNGAGKLHVFYELGDHLGSTSVVLDQATGELVERTTFEGYGATESDYRPGRWKSYREDRRFTGKEEDVEVGLYYFGKRYLNPLLGRWVSADPLALALGGGDLNCFAYVHGQVLQATDPLGLQEAGASVPGGAAPGPTGGEIKEDETPKTAADATPASAAEAAVNTAAERQQKAQPPRSQPPPAPKIKMSDVAKGGPAAVVGYRFGVASGQVPIIGPLAADAVSYGVRHLTPPSIQVGFGTGLAASSLHLALQAGTETPGGGAVALGTGAETAGAGALLGGAISLHGVAVAVAGANNLGAGLWLIEAGKDDGAGGGPQQPTKMFGSQGTQMTSKTVWKGPKGMRIDVENPNPGQRPGQIHFQQGEAKYLYDPAQRTFNGAPRAVNKLLESADVQKGIDKAMRFLGEQ